MARKIFLVSSSRSSSSCLRSFVGSMTSNGSTYDVRSVRDLECKMPTLRESVGEIATVYRPLNVFWYVSGGSFATRLSRVDCICRFLEAMVDVRAPISGYLVAESAPVPLSKEDVRRAVRSVSMKMLRAVRDRAGRERRVDEEEKKDWMWER